MLPRARPHGHTTSGGETMPRDTPEPVGARLGLEAHGLDRTGAARCLADLKSWLALCSQTGKASSRLGKVWTHF